MRVTFNERDYDVRGYRWGDTTAAALLMHNVAEGTVIPATLIQAPNALGPDQVLINSPDQPGSLLHVLESAGAIRRTDRQMAVDGMSLPVCDVLIELPPVRGIEKSGESRPLSILSDRVDASATRPAQADRTPEMDR